MPELKASAENVGTIRDEAAREYEYIVRAMESLDTKATACLAAALAVFSFAAGVDGEAWARWLMAGLSLIAGIFSACALSPESVRLPQTRALADHHGADKPLKLLLQVAAQYIDAVEAARHPISVKAIRLRVSLVLLFAAATTLVWH